MNTEETFLENIGFTKDQIESLREKETVEETDPIEYSFIDFLNSIGQSGDNLLREPHEVEYSKKRMNEYRFGIRRYFSKFVDCVFIINEVNLKSHMSPMMENDFLINKITKKKRFSGKTNKENKIKQIMERFGYSYAKAKEIESLVEVL